MARLTLPFQQSGSTNEILFEITCTAGGGAAIKGASYGTDQFGDSGTGVYGESDVGVGVGGGSESGSGINGSSDSGQGVSGWSYSGQGVWATTDVGVGLVAISGGADLTGFSLYNGAAIQAFSSVDADAINSTSYSSNHAAVSGHNNAGGFGLWASSTTGGRGIGVYARGASYAGVFDGTVQVNGDLLVTGDVVLINQAGDVAEDFDIEPEPRPVEPGTVLVINEQGNMCTSELPYDTRVAGVVAGAGDLKPAVVLQRTPSPKLRLPIALVGKAFCKVDATFGRIVAGDLLTTSSTRGHAMKATDASRSIGAVIGKALTGLDAGVGLIPILVSPR